MKYIYRDNEGTWQLGRYFDYVSTIQEKLPADLIDLCGLHRFDIRSRASLHDSWLSRLSLKDQFLGSDALDQIDLEIELLGPYHDRTFFLRYSGIRFHEIRIRGLASGENRGDLLVHELRMGEQENFEHELWFSNQDRIEIHCEKMFFSESKT